MSEFVLFEILKKDVYLVMTFWISPFALVFSSINIRVSARCYGLKGL